MLRRAKVTAAPPRCVAVVRAPVSPGAPSLQSPPKPTLPLPYPPPPPPPPPAGRSESTRARLRHHRPLRRRQGHADPGAARARPRARARRLRDDPRSRGPGDPRASTTTSSPTRSSRTASTRATSSSTPATRAAATGRSERSSSSEARGSKPVLLEIEVQGARQVRQAMPEATQVFIAPPSEEALQDPARRARDQLGGGRRAAARDRARGARGAGRVRRTWWSTTGSRTPSRSSRSRSRQLRLTLEFTAPYGGLP